MEIKLDLFSFMSHVPIALSPPPQKKNLCIFYHLFIFSLCFDVTPNSDKSTNLLIISHDQYCCEGKETSSSLMAQIR